MKEVKTTSETKKDSKPAQKNEQIKSKKNNKTKSPKEKTFRMISKITPQKAKGRYNIFIDDEFAFGVDEEVLLKFQLTKGLHVPQDLQKKIEDEDTYHKAYQKTLNYLSYSLRTEKQIRDYLTKNDLSIYTTRIISRLIELNLLDDLNYAQNYVRTMANVNQKGLRNVEQDLYQKGISENDALIALEEYTEEKQFENAKDLAEKQWKKKKNNSQFESIQKIKRYLVNKGYSFEQADYAIAAIDTELDDEEEYKALSKQADKALRRYSRKYEGYDLIQRLKQYLYSKKYPKTLINRYIEEKELE
jgi:regulatory protein